MVLRGVSLVEFLIVVGIGLIIVTLFAAGFMKFNNAESLFIGTRDASSFITRARAQTLTGLGGNQYGIHVASTTLTLFTGSSYSADSSSNVVFPLSTGLVVMSVNLSGGGVDILFDKLTGATSKSGNLIFQINSDSSRTQTIVISSTGIVNIPNIQ